MTFNVASSGGGVYQGSYSTVSSLTAIRCTIKGNVAQVLDGSGIYACDAVELDACEISLSSYARSESSLHMAYRASVTATNCVFSANGRIYAHGDLELTNCTITDRLVRCDPCDPVARVNLKNCIVQSSIPAEAELSHCLVDRDPLFVREGVFDYDKRISMQIGGVSGETVDMPDYVIVEPDFRLRAGSPALDAGTQNGAPETDIEGNRRPCFNAIDVGAYEHCEGGVESVDIAEVCFNEEVGFDNIPDGDVDGILVLDGMSLAECFAGQSVRTVDGIDSLSGVPTNPLSLVAGSNGENLFRSTVGGDSQLSGKSPVDSFQGTMAVLFDADQSELVIKFFQLIWNNIVIDFYDRRGGRIERVVVPFGESFRGTLGFAREGGVADIAGFSLQIGEDNRARPLNAQSIGFVRFARNPETCGGEARFLRGDCNDDGGVDLSDAVCILAWLFLGEAEPGCIAVTNTNGDAAADLSDSVYVMTHLFLGGPAPAEPYPTCGSGGVAADEDLGCERSPESCPQ